MKKGIEQVVEELTLPIIEKHNFELVDVEYVKEGGDYFLRVYIDKEGGITLDDCHSVSTDLSTLLDEKDPIKDNYYLEVSSPGLDRPLKKAKDFERYIGRDVEVKLYKPIEGQKQFEGELLGLFDEDIIKIIYNGNEMSFNKKEVAIIRLAIKF
jgi:ribosome maturation factor RimP